MSKKIDLARMTIVLIGERIVSVIETSVIETIVSVSGTVGLMNEMIARLSNTIVLVKIVLV